MTTLPRTPRTRPTDGAALHAELTLRAAQGEVPTWDDAAWIAALRHGVTENGVDDTRALVPAALLSRLIQTGGEGARQWTAPPGLEALLGRRLREEPGTVQLLANGLTRMEDALHAALDLDAAWLLAHSGHGTQSGDRALLHLARPERLTRQDVLALLAPTRRTRTRAWEWRKLYAHPALTRRDVRALLRARIREDRRMDVGDWAQPLLTHPAADVSDVAALIAASPRLLNDASITPTPALLDAVMAALETRAATSPHGGAGGAPLLQVPGLGEARGRRVIALTLPCLGGLHDVIVNLGGAAPVTWIQDVAAHVQAAYDAGRPLHGPVGAVLLEHLLYHRRLAAPQPGTPDVHS